MPVLALGWQAARGSEGLWSHLGRHVLPHALMQTAILMAGVGATAAKYADTDDDFAAITRMICDMAADLSAPVVSCLEGGYDLDALGRSARAHVQVLLEARE